MVDFNNESTITRNVRDILEIQIIERQTYVIDAIEVYNKNKYDNRIVPLSYVRSRLYSYYMILKPSLINEYADVKEETILDKINKLVKSDKYDDIIECFELLNNYIYKKNLIKWDSMKTYNKQSIEEENKFHGLD